MSRPFDPARQCGAKTNPLNGATPCRMPKGTRTDHLGAGHCWLHGGTNPSGRKHAASEARAKAALEAFADFTLSAIGDALAREAAARAFATLDEAAEEFSRNVTAFARAADRAEGAKVTVEGKLEFLANLPDAELDAAIAEAQRLVNAARGRDVEG